MDLNALDKDLQILIANRIELLKINYNNPKYDELEEKLHDVEDAFHEKYGTYLEEVLQDVHDEHCPDSDVLMPIAYLAKRYTISEKGLYSVDFSEGAYVESQAYPDKETKLVILPNPLRILLNVSTETQKVIWEGKA